MSFEKPLLISRLLLPALGTQVFLHYGDRIPAGGPILVVSNHRSFMDAPLLMVAISRSIRFACHHYMVQVPLLREMVEQLGCLPLEAQGQQQQRFFQAAGELLQTRQTVGIFPEGTPPMVQVTQPQEVGIFQRGFAHLALRVPVSELAILPIAIAADAEISRPTLPLKLFSVFDPSEPLFNQTGWHPLVLYQRVNVLVGHPHWVTPKERQGYHGKGARAVINELSDRCQTEIKDLLRQGCF